MLIRGFLLATAFVVLLAGCTAEGAVPSPEPVQSTVQATPAPAPVVLLQPGECTGPAAYEYDRYDDILKADCDRPHHYEIVALVPIAGEEWPGFTTVRAVADRECPGAFTAWVGAHPDDSIYTARGIPPAQSDWGFRDRRVVACLAGSDGGGIVGSVRGDTRKLPSLGECTGPLNSEKLSLIACTKFHNYEVVGERPLWETTPDAAAQNRFCRERFAAYVGVPAGTSRYAFLDDWGALASFTGRDRRLVCLAGPLDMIGSIKGARQ